MCVDCYGFGSNADIGEKRFKVVYKDRHWTVFCGLVCERMEASELSHTRTDNQHIRYPKTKRARRACQIDGLLFGLHCDRQASIVRHFQKLSRFPAATGPDDAYHSSASISLRPLICAPPSTKPSARSIARPSPSARAQSPEPTCESPIARGCRGATSGSFASFGR